VEKVGDLSSVIGEGNIKETIKIRFAEAYGGDPRSIGRNAQQIVNFAKRVKERDYVVAGDGQQVLGIGRVSGPYLYAPDQPFPHRRSVEWIRIDNWQLPTTEGLRTTVHEYKNHPDNLVALEQRVLESHLTPAVPTAGITQAPVQGQRKSLQWTGEGMVGRIQDVLSRKGQLILYGPPGTGKTYWAERATATLAALWNFGAPFEALGPSEQASITGNGTDAFVRSCSFHPGYGYEDFLEGFRPDVADGSLRFIRRDGLFKVLCDDARKDRDHRYYLIIDEINRGDIPRIFGELITLLDKPKRGTSVRLPLSGDTFTVPENVFVIGTMNTADRSIALLDTALRRRFGFVELLPDATTLGDAVIQGIPLGPWLAALNRLVAAHVGRDGRSLQIGHSFFLSGEKPIQEFRLFVRILQEDILPLLEEYCYDDWDTLEKNAGPGFG
jgi:5-methylcytosine-specific restriction protein B